LFPPIFKIPMQIISTNIEWKTTAFQNFYDQNSISEKEVPS
jgi:hypothetical protein